LLREDKGWMEIDENPFVIWSSIMKIDMNVKRNKMRLNAINNLFNTILTLDIRYEYWPGLLRLSHDIISAKHVLIPDITVDLIILISLKSFEKEYMDVSVCEELFAIYRTLIKAKINLVIDRLPNLLLLYRRIINIIVHESKKIDNKCDNEHYFRHLAFDITK